MVKTDGYNCDITLDDNYIDVLLECDINKGIYWHDTHRGKVMICSSCLMFIYIYIYMCVCIYVCVYVCVCMYVCVCVCV